MDFKNSTHSFFTASLLALLLVFALPVQAQDKENLQIKNTTVAYQIDKNTKQEELDMIKKEVNDEKVATLKFSDIKRNDKGEIIAINTEFKDERGMFQQKTEYNSMGINPFSIIIHKNENGEKYLEIGSENKKPFLNGNFHTNSKNQNSLFEDSENNSSDGFFSDDFMELMKSMQEDMQKQQENFRQMLQSMQNEQPATQSKTEK